MNLNDKHLCQISRPKRTFIFREMRNHNDLHQRTNQATNEQITERSNEHVWSQYLRVEIINAHLNCFVMKSDRYRPNLLVILGGKRGQSRVQRTKAIGVGAQSTLGGTQNFCPKNMYYKSAKCPNFTWFLSGKLSKYPNFYDICPKNLQNSRILHDFCPKMPEFYIMIARKILFPEF